MVQWRYKVFSKEIDGQKKIHPDSVNQEYHRFGVKINGRQHDTRLAIMLQMTPGSMSLHSPRSFEIGVVPRSLPKKTSSRLHQMTGFRRTCVEARRWFHHKQQMPSVLWIWDVSFNPMVFKGVELYLAPLDRKVISALLSSWAVRVCRVSPPPSLRIWHWPSVALVFEPKSVSHSCCE